MANKNWAEKGMKLQLNNPIFIVKSFSYRFHRLILHKKYQKISEPFRTLRMWRVMNVRFEILKTAKNANSCKNLNLEIKIRILSERIGRGMSGKFNIQNVDLQFILVKAEFVNVNAQKRTQIETSSFVLNPGYTQPIFWPKFDLIMTYDLRREVSFLKSRQEIWILELIYFLTVKSKLLVRVRNYMLVLRVGCKRLWKYYFCDERSPAKTVKIPFLSALDTWESSEKLRFRVKLADFWNQGP